MLQISEFVNVNDKINDKIAQIEQRNRRMFTEKEKSIAFEMFMSGFLFASQWYGNELGPEDHDNY